jgi:tetratricopeptide (TPR) repeat protein
MTKPDEAESAILPQPAVHPAFLETADELWRQGALDEAKVVYERVLTGSPGNLRAILGLGRCAEQRGESLLALEHFQAAVAANPAAPWPRISAGNVLRILARAEEAEEAFRQALSGTEDTPARVQALLGLGHCAQARGDHAAALNHFQAAVANDPANGWTHLYAGVALRALGRATEAETECRLALADSATRAKALLELAQCAQERGDRAAALEHFRAAAAANPGDLWAHLHAGNELRQLGRIEEAEAAYREASVGAGSLRLQASLGLGHCAEQRGDHAVALQHFQAGIAAAPADPWPHLYAGHALRELDRLEEARDAYRQALAAAGAGAVRLHALLGLGHCAQQRGDHAEALEHFQAATADKPADPWPHFYAAGMFRQLGQPAAAEAAYQRALASDPRHPQAIVGLGLLARERGDRTAAATLFERAVTAAPDAPDAWLEVAAELRDRGESARACAIAGDLLARDPRNAEAWMSLAHTHHSDGHWEAALDALRHLVEINPRRPDPWIDMALNELRLCRPEAAEQNLKTALACAPDNARALENLAELARLARSFERALALLHRAAAAHPANPWPRIRLSHTLADLGRLTDALEALDEAEARISATDAARPAIVAKRLELLQRAGHWTRAFELARAAATAWPRHFGLWLQRCMVELLLGDASSIAACLDAAPAATVQEEARVQQFRGLAAQAAWRLDDALEHYARALQAAPTDGWIHKNMARIRLLRLDLREARPHLDAMARLDADFVIRRGRPLRISWTQEGYILNESAVNREALAAVRDACDRPAAARIPPLLAAVRAFPGYTPAATSLLIALRQAGKLATPATGERTLSPIPRTIVQYWDSGRPPPDVLALMQTWQNWNPDHTVRWFDDAAARDFLANAFTPDVLLAYSRVREPAQKADLFRLAWLFARGGCYVDCDDRCHAPLTSIMPPNVTLVLYQEDLGTLGNNFIATIPQHPVIGRALDLAVDSVLAGDGDEMWFATGPGLLTRAFACTLAESRQSWPVWLENVAVLDRGVLYRAVAIHCFAGYKLTERHWSEAGLGRNRRK